MESYHLIRKDKLEINQIKSKDKFDNLKSDYFLEKLFNNLKKKRTFDILKYNKNLKKRINITINDYKKYAEKYSSIEIEIKPVDNNEYGKFINIKEEKKYYHIYFTYNKEEINRDFIWKYEGMNRIIKIIINYQIKSLENLFNIVA